MAWIELHQTLKRHPKTRRFANHLGIPKPQAVGHLAFLWLEAVDFAQDGDVTDFEPAEIAEWAEWEGEPHAFHEALVQYGWLDRNEKTGRTHLHDWLDYAGKLVQRRKANANRMKSVRATHMQNTCNARAEHVQRTCETRAGTVETHVQSDSTQPHPTVPNRTVPTSPPKPPPPPAQSVQTVAGGGGSGASRSGSGGVGWKCLNRMAVSDLEDDDQLERRRKAAIRAGLWDDSEAARFAWFALAERALRIGDSPPAMFRRLVQDRPDCIDQQDEDRASIRLNGRGPPAKRKQEKDQHNPVL